MRPKAIFVVAVPLAALWFSPASDAAGPSAEETDRAKLLLSRATFGPRPGDLDRILAQGTRAWLDVQLWPEKIDDSPVDRSVSQLENLGLSTSALMAKYPRPTREEREAMAKGGSRNRGDGPGRVLMELSHAKLFRAVHSERQLHEVMVDFWFNHFNVYARKNRNTLLSLPSFERDAIRPHALGRFEELLVATAEHPAMLFYLDNWINTKDGFDPRETILAQSGPRRRSRRVPREEESRKFGINENYARELMELHTLGVDGGYDQRDVVEVARALTGWSVVGPQAARMRERVESRMGRARVPQALLSMPAEGNFFFNASAHDRAPKTVLGTLIDAGGVGDGRAVLRLLSRHASTARFISTKLAERFVADHPSDALIEEMSDTFLRTRGDIREVLRTMFDSRRFVEEAIASDKFKSPLELVVSAMRATGGEVEGPELVRAVSDLGMPLYLCQPPTGYDEDASWLSAGSVLNRIRFAGQLASGRLRGVGGAGPPEDFDDWASQILLDVDALPGDEGRGDIERLALVLSSPAFQRQ